MKLLKTILFFIFTQAFIILAWQSPLFTMVPVNAHLQGAYIGLHTEILEDPENSYSIFEIKSKLFSEKWIKSRSHTVNYGFSKSAYWVRFKLDNPDENHDLFLEYGYPPMDRVDFYALDRYNNVLIEKSVGDSLPYSERDIVYRNVIFDLNAENKKIETYLLKFSTQSSINIDLKLWDYKNLLEMIDTEQGFLHLYFGLIIALLFYNIFLFFSVREISYLYYSAFLATSFIFDYTLLGNAYRFFDGDSLYWFNNNIPLFLNLTNITGLIFSRSFLNSKEQFKRIDRFLFILVIIFSVLIILSIFGSYEKSIKMSMPFSFILYVTMVVVGITAYIRGYAAAKYFMIAFGVLLIASMTVILKTIGVMEVNFFTTYIIYFGRAANMILLALALADRINILKEEKEKAVQEKIARRELEEQKSRFFSNVSHEIRTPLTLMLSPIESYLQGDYKKDIGREFFENLYRNGLTLFKLINNLLDLSKIEAGRMNMRIVEIDIQRFARNYVASLQSACDSRGISLCFDIGETIGKTPESPLLLQSNFDSKGVAFRIESSRIIENIYADPEKLDRIFLNLLSNALKFTDSGGSISIHISEDDEFCRIEFRDSGHGIPESAIATIFDRFTQANTSATRRNTGTGIGLALAKELVEMHGGTITVASRYIEEHPQNHGTIFAVNIPKGRSHLEGRPDVIFGTGDELDEFVSDHRCADMRGMSEISGFKRPEEHPPADNDSSIKPLTVLIVDDNPDMRDFLVSLLHSDYNVFTAENGRLGLEALDEYSPDLIVTDVMMPEMDGYEMTRRIKEHETGKHIPVIMLTAKAEISQKIEGIEFGADDYLTKPFNSKELLTRIRMLLKTREYEKTILRRNQEIEQELEVARLLQQKLLPETPEPVPGYAFHAVYIPMDKIGGDFYDYLRHTKYIDIFIADVSGHGLPGAFLAMMSKMAYEGIRTRSGTAADLLIVNEVICRSTVQSNFVTAFLCSIDTETNMMRYSSAGHQPPLLLRGNSGELIELKAKGIPLGWVSGVDLEEKAIQLESGDRLVFYTDGITETMNADNQLFGEENLYEFIKRYAGLAPEEFSLKLISTLKEFSSSDKFDDDLTMVVFDLLKNNKQA